MKVTIIEKISPASADVQPKTIADPEGYYEVPTVEGALSQIGATLDGLADNLEDLL